MPKLTLFLPQHYSLSRYPEQFKHVQHYRSAVHSVPDERIAPPRRLDPSSSPRKSRVDPLGAEAANHTRYPRDQSESREQRLLDLEAQQKKRQQLLQQQMEHQQLQMQRQMYEQQMQHQRQMLEQQRQTVSRRKSTVKKTEVKKGDPKVADLNKPGLYDRYAGAESTSGFSMYSDKYRTVNQPKKRSEPTTDGKPEAHSSSTGVKLGRGEFATPLAVVPAAMGTVVASTGESQQLRDVEVNIAESCPEDFMETMFMSPPSPPTIEETTMISEGVQEMAIASNDAIAKDSCGILMPADEDDVIVVPSMDWYGKAVPAAKDSCVADFIHTLWTCR